MLSEYIQYLVDHWPEPLEEGGITFPDGLFWPTTKSRAVDTKFRSKSPEHNRLYVEEKQKVDAEEYKYD